MDDTGQEPSSVNGFSNEAPAADAVDAMVDRVRQDLADRRAAGEIPDLPAGELDRQFSAVIDAVDAGLIEELPPETAELARLAALETWQSRAGGLRGRVVRLVMHIPSRLVGALVRRQVEGFSRKVTALIEQIISRQTRIATFLARVHLDRLRSLEYRVAELERELTVLRRESSERLAVGASEDAGGDR